MEVIMRKYNNAPMPGRYQVYLAQQRRTFEGSSLGEQTCSDAVIEISYKPFSERLKMIGSCFDEVLFGRNKKLVNEGDATPMTILLTYGRSTISIRSL